MFMRKSALLERAYLRVGGGGSQRLRNRRKKVIKAVIGPSQPEQQEVVKAVLAPAHTNTLEALLNQPFTGTFHHLLDDNYFGG